MSQPARRRNAVLDVIKSRAGKDVKRQDVAKATGIDDKSVSALATQLERLGEVERVGRGVYRYTNGTNGNGAIALAEPAIERTTRTYTKKRSADQKVADALKALYPDGEKTRPDPLLLLQWLDITRELING